MLKRPIGLWMLLCAMIPFLSPATAKAESAPPSKPAPASASPAPAAPRTRPHIKILVRRLKANAGVTDKDVLSISDFLAAEIERQTHNEVLTESDLTSLIEQNEMAQCVGEEGSCMAEIGSALNADEYVTGNLGRVGESWILNLRRFNVRDVKPIRAYSDTVKGQIDAVLDIIPYAVADLYRLPPPKKRASKAAQAETSPYLISGAVLTSVGLATVGIGIGGTFAAKKAKEDYEKSGDSKDSDRHQTMTGLAIGGYVAGSLAAATGVLLLVLDPARSGSQREENDRPDAAVGPISNHGAAVWLQWRW